MFQIKTILFALLISFISFSVVAEESYKSPRVKLNKVSLDSDFSVKKDDVDSVFDYKVDEKTKSKQDRSFASDSPAPISYGEKKSEDKIKTWKHND